MIAAKREFFRAWRSRFSQWKGVVSRDELARGLGVHASTISALTESPHDKDVPDKYSVPDPFAQQIIAQLMNASPAIQAKVSAVHPEQQSWTKVVKPGKLLAMDAETWTLLAAKDKDGNKRPPDAPLCPTADGTPFTYSIIKKAFASIIKATQLQRFTPHAIRHGRACWDLLDGKTVHQVKSKLGHSSVMVTERYLRTVELLRRQELPGTIHHRAPCCDVATREVRPVSVCQPCDKPSFSGVHSGLTGSTKKVHNKGAKSIKTKDL